MSAAKLQSICRLALCPSSQDGEWKSAAEAFFRICRTRNLNPFDANLANEAKPNLPTMPFGKHKGKTIEWIVENDPCYAEWAVETIKSTRLRKFFDEALQKYNAPRYPNGVESQNGYPEVPKPFVTFEGNGSGLPQAPGVYFAWRHGVVQYVGQSINLSARCKDGHHKLQKGDSLSYVLIPKHELNFAESFYIGVLKPLRNFGERYKRKGCN